MSSPKDCNGSWTESVGERDLNSKKYTRTVRGVAGAGVWILFTMTEEGSVCF